MTKEPKPIAIIEGHAIHLQVQVDGAALPALLTRANIANVVFPVASGANFLIGLLQIVGGGDTRASATSFMLAAFCAGGAYMAYVAKGALMALWMNTKRLTIMQAKADIEKQKYAPDAGQEVEVVHVNNAGDHFDEQGRPL